MVKKGIAPVISVVLLIMLVVAITGGAYYWMTNVQGSMQERVGSSIQESSEMSTASFSIVSAVCSDNVVNLTVINTGNQQIDLTENSPLITVSTIQGSNLGTCTSTSYYGSTISSDGGSARIWAGNSGINPDNSYSVRLNIGSASQTTTCTT